MKIWTLMENTACREELATEHGLSLYIETGTHKILFDAGQSGAFADNARKMGVDLGQVTLAVLSHGHYDHGDGLGRFLSLNSFAMIYVNQHAFEPHYHGAEKYIGLDPALLESGRIIFTGGEITLAPGVTLYTAIPCPHPIDSSGLTVLENGSFRPEDFRHEQYLMIEENGRKILFSGCSHRGILNIAEYFCPDVLIGGFHFMNLTDEATLKAAAQALMAQPTRYYTGHCTGQQQFAVLKAVMGERAAYLSGGTVLEI